MGFNEYILFSISALCFLLLLLIVYFTKKRVKLIENNIYICMIILTIIGIFFELALTFGGLVIINHSIIKDIIAKGFLVVIEIWAALLSMYTFMITNNVSYDNLKLFRKKIILLYLPLILFGIATCILPIEYIYNYNETSILYTIGLSTKVVLLSGLFYLLLSLYYIVARNKNTKDRRFIPIYTYIGMSLFVSVLQQIEPSLILLSFTESLILVLMYFTIENPDLAMIEQLNIARDQADRANHAKSEFLSSMSHEIRTPLNAIVGFSQALQEEDLPEQAQEEVKDIVRASESLLELVNGILDISKIEANKIEIVDGEYNVYEILNDLTALAKARMGDKKLEFKTYFDQSIPQVLYGDSVRIKQIILNLLTNSIKYTKEGEVIFRVSSIQNNEVCRLIVSVEDTGIGIKKESIDKLFTKFQRLDLEKNKTIEGTGLGLAITKKLVELMNGRIMVQSVYGKGSKFTVALDQKIIHKEVTQEEVKKEVTDEVFDLSSKKILIVDDNKLNLKVASRLIEKYKCEIETIESGFECLDKIKAGEHFDLILMDDMMPEMGGVETFHKLKEIDNFNIPVIALTANAISGMREKYLAEGFNDYLSKPIDKSELNKVLQIIKN